MPLEAHPPLLEGSIRRPTGTRPSSRPYAPCDFLPTRVPLVSVVLLAPLAPKALLVKLAALVKLACLVPR